MKRRINIGYFIKEGFQSVFSHGLMSFAAVCMIVACLIIMGSFSLLAVNVDDNLKQLEDENEFLAYIDESLTTQEIETLMGQVDALDNVAEVKFITREEAKAVYLEDHEGDGLYASIPDDVFRDRLSIHVKDLSLFTETVDTVDDMPGVANLRAEGELAEGFVAVRNAITAVAWVLIAILAAVSLFIIANTIRLATFARREEIAIMKMCGATDWFVRGPFVVEGLLLGVMGALVAFLIQWAVYAAVCRAFVESGAVALFSLTAFGDIWTRVLGIFMAAGAGIGALGSGFAIRRFLQV